MKSLGDDTVITIHGDTTKDPLQQGRLAGRHAEQHERCTCTAPVT